MPRKIVDTFNVEGEEYSIEPVMDAVPTQGSPNAVQSGGVYADKSNVPVQDSTKNFTAGGAFDFFGKSTYYRDWLAKLFAPQMFKRAYLLPCNNRSLPEASCWRPFGFANGKWYATHYISRYHYEVQWSEDLEHWYPTTDAMYFREDDMIYTIEGPDSSVVIFSGTGLTGSWYSTDGINFTQLDLSVFGAAEWRNIADLAYVYDAWYVLLANSSFSARKLCRTTDFVNVTDCTIGLTDTTKINIPMHGNDAFMLPTLGEKLWRSTDGITFTQVTSAPAYCSCVMCVKGKNTLTTVGTFESPYSWIMLCRTSNSGSWHLYMSDAGTYWEGIRTTFAPADGSYTAILYGNKIVYANTSHSAYTGLYVWSINDALVGQLTNINGTGKQFNSVNSLQCVNGVWIIEHVQTDPNYSGVDGGVWVSDDLEHWWKPANENSALVPGRYGNGFYVISPDTYCDVALALEEMVANNALGGRRSR